MRQHKQSGAWMSDYRAQSRTGSGDGSSVVPIIVNNNNFAKGSEVREFLMRRRRDLLYSLVLLLLFPFFILIIFHLTSIEMNNISTSIISYFVGKSNSSEL